MTDTATFTDTDNFENVQEPETTDNSLNEHSEKPDEVQIADDNNEKESTSELILGKFKTQDDLINAYSALEKHQGEKAKEFADLKAKAEFAETLQKQQQEIAELFGFKNVDELKSFQNQKKVDKALANFIADEYVKHINEIEFPDEMRNLLLQYKQNPDDELLNTIKGEFPLSVIEQVAVNIEKYKGQLERKRFQALEQKEIENAGNYLKENIAKYNDDRYFKNDIFKSIYTELFKAFGTNLDTDYTINKIESYVQSRIAQHEKQKTMNKENSNLTDTFGGLAQNDNITSSQKPVLDMSAEELSKALRTTYKHL